MRVWGSALLLVLVAAPAEAQSRERGYIALSGAGQIATSTLVDRFVYTVNVEEATTEARYPSAGVMFDAGVGRRFWRTMGAAIHVSRSSAGGRVQTDSLIPHPFFDDRHRAVSGGTGEMAHTETALHVQLYYVRDFGRHWRVRLGAGPSYFTVSKDVVSGVTVNEQFPFDTATFGSAMVERAKDSSPGLNAGADIGWMFTRRLGASALVRFARGKVEFNLDGTHRVSTHAGGAQAGAGVRIAF